MALADCHLMPFIVVCDISIVQFERRKVDEKVNLNEN